MKKISILLVIVGIVVGAWIGATYVIGKQADDRYFDSIEQYGQWGFITASSQNYSYGLLNSQVETKIEMTIPVAPADPNAIAPDKENMTIVLHHTLHHGPVPFSGPEAYSPALALIETRMLSFSPADDDFEKLLQKVPELHQSTALIRVGFNGNAQTDMVIPAFEVEQDGEYVRWDGFSTTTAYSPSAETLDGNFKVHKLEMRFDDSSILWDGMHGSFDLVKELPMLYIGDSSLSFGALKMDLPAPQQDEREVLQVQPIEVIAQSSLEDGVVNIKEAIKAEGMTFNDESYGPLLFDLEMNNLDGVALSEYQQAMMSLYTDVDIFDPDPELMVEKILPLYSDILSKMAKRDPELKIKQFHLMTPQGQIDGNFQMKWVGLEEFDLNDPMALLAMLQHIEADSKISIDEALIRGFIMESTKQQMEEMKTVLPDYQYTQEELEQEVDQQMEEQLQVLLAQNFIIREDGKIRSSASFKQGELMVNGAAVPLF